jgi:environmental stress-induced protein Ves
MEERMAQFGMPRSDHAPLAVRIVHESAHRTMPWKNGAGTTTEIAIDPAAADLGSRFHWRLSIASVQRSGPFSAFPGYERTIMLIEGDGMDLAVGGGPVRRLDRAFEPFVFSGDAPVECRLIKGPVRDFNLMVDRSLSRSWAQVWHADSVTRSIELASAGHLIHCFEGAVDLACARAGWSCTLRANETAVFQQVRSSQADLQVAPVPNAPPTVAVIALMAQRAA